MLNIIAVQSYFGGMKLLKQLALSVVLPLLAGAAFYRCLRQNRPPLFAEGQPLGVVLPAAAQCVPSLLWSFALASALLLVWRPSAKKRAWMLAGIAAATASIFEGWQAAGAGRGTFDWYDLLASLVGCAIAVPVFFKIATT
jgi:hypothetical protein